MKKLVTTETITDEQILQLYNDEVIAAIDYSNAVLRRESIGGVLARQLCATMFNAALRAEETDEEYHERTGEPRGAGADWAGRVRGDFQE